MVSSVENNKITVFYGTFGDTPTLNQLRLRFNTAVGVSDDTGTILFIKEHCQEDPLNVALAFDPSRDKRDINIVNLNPNDSNNGMTQFFFPGFIDTHIHAPQYPDCGLFGNSTLLDWLNKYTFPIESSFDDLKVANKIYTNLVQRSLSNGTTTASYFTTIHENSSKLMAHICSDSNQRAFIGKVCMNRNSPDYYIEPSTKESLDSTKQVIEYIENRLCDKKIKPIITPRFAPSCSDDLLLKLGELAKKQKLNIQTHLSENKAEIEWVKQLFPQSGSYTDVYYQHDLLTSRTVLAHSIHLDQSELDIIKKCGSGIAHCPISNSCLTSGECHVRRLLNNNIKVGLGTDVSAGFTTSILANARHAHMVSRHVAMKCQSEEESEFAKLSVVECLYLATMGGARVMDMDDEIGSFEVGKQFDAQFIDLLSQDSQVNLFEIMPPNSLDLISHWFFNGDDRNVMKVWVDGKISHSK